MAGFRAGSRKAWSGMEGYTASGGFVFSVTVSSLSGGCHRGGRRGSFKCERKRTRERIGENREEILGVWGLLWVK